MKKNKLLPIFACFCLALFILSQVVRKYAIDHQTYIVFDSHYNQYTVHVTDVKRESDRIYIDDIEIPTASFVEDSIYLNNDEILQTLKERGIIT